MVCAVLDKLPHRGANAFHAVGLLVAPVEVSAGDGDGPTAEEQTGGGDVAPLGALPEVECHLVAGAVLTEGCDAGFEVDHGVLGGPQQHDFVGVTLDNVLVAGAWNAEHEVGVGVDEAGEQVAVGEAVAVDVGPFRQGNLSLAVHDGDSVALGDDNRMVYGAVAGSVDEGLGFYDIYPVRIEGCGAAGLQPVETFIEALGWYCYARRVVVQDFLPF